MNKALRLPLLALACTLTMPAVSSAAQVAASGRVDVNGDMSFESNQSDFEEGAPLARTSVSVADSQAGYGYFAEADVTVPRLRVFGQLNNTGSAASNVETFLLAVNAQVEDTLTLTSTLAGTYPVTVEMDVDGVLDVTGSDGLVAAFLQLSPAGGLGVFEQETWNTDGEVFTTISVTNFFSGSTVDVDVFSRIFFRVAQIDAGASVSADFGSTAVLRLVLPDGVELVGSESGAFATVPIPVPAAFPLLLSALGVLALRRRC